MLISFSLTLIYDIMTNNYGGRIMLYYTKEDVLDLNNHEGQYYMPHALFDTMQYKLVRLEVKWAYVACLNALLDHPLYDEASNAYLKDDDQSVALILKDLANKKVDQNKVDGYIEELEGYELLERKGRDIYLKKIVNIF